MLEIAKLLSLFPQKDFFYSAIVSCYKKAFCHFWNLILTTQLQWSVPESNVWIESKENIAGCQKTEIRGYKSKLYGIWSHPGDEAQCWAFKRWITELSRIGSVVYNPSSPAHLNFWGITFDPNLFVNYAFWSWWGNYVTSYHRCADIIWKSYKSLEWKKIYGNWLRPQEQVKIQ